MRGIPLIRPGRFGEQDVPRKDLIGPNDAGIEPNKIFAGFNVEKGYGAVATVVNPAVCRVIVRTRPRDQHPGSAFIVQNEHAAVEVDERQYERGAMLVIPRKHRESVLDIEERELKAVYGLVRLVARAATIAFGAVGMNVYQNNGTKAGQHEPHFHVHVVPRYKSSDPDRRFLQRDHSIISIEEQRAIAEAIQARL